MKRKCTGTWPGIPFLLSFFLGPGTAKKKKLILAQVKRNRRNAGQFLCASALISQLCGRPFITSLSLLFLFMGVHKLWVARSARRLSTRLWPPICSLIPFLLSLNGRSKSLYSPAATHNVSHTISFLDRSKFLSFLPFLWYAVQDYYEKNIKKEVDGFPFSLLSLLMTQSLIAAKRWILSRSWVREEKKGTPSPPTSFPFLFFYLLGTRVSSLSLSFYLWDLVPSKWEKEIRKLGDQGFLYYL